MRSADRLREDFYRMNDKLLVLGTMAYDAIESPFGKTGKILGDTGSWYKTENKKKTS